jgi:hypothetical protein
LTTGHGGLAAPLHFFYSCTCYATTPQILADIDIGATLDEGGRHECILARWGRVAWRARRGNLVTTQGKNYLLTQAFAPSGGGSWTPTWFIGIKGTGTIAAADTAATHAGWTELTTYTQAVRPAFVRGTPASGAVDNSGSKAQFTANASMTVAGIGMWTDSAKGGTTGTLYGAADFASTQAMASTNVLLVTATVSFP